MSGWTEADVENVKRAREVNSVFRPPTPPILKLPRAKGRVKPSKGMNKTETAYSAHLEVEKRIGDILWYRFEGITVKLGDDCRFTPDFAVMRSDGSLELHDTKIARKGQMRPHIEDDALVKLRTASEMYPFRIVAVWPGTNGEWEAKEF